MDSKAGNLSNVTMKNCFHPKKNSGKCKQILKNVLVISSKPKPNCSDRSWLNLSISRNRLFTSTINQRARQQIRLNGDQYPNLLIINQWARQQIRLNGDQYPNLLIISYRRSVMISKWLFSPLILLTGICNFSSANRPRNHLKRRKRKCNFLWEQSFKLV